MFRPIYIFVIIELHTRRIIHTAVTDEWVTQQLREVTAWSQRPKYLIHDRDKKYGPLFSSLLKHTGVVPLLTPPQT